MAAPFDSLPQMSFAGIPFRIRGYSVRGGQREVTHERPYQPGGIEEILGRRLYTIDVDAVFVVGREPFPNAWPDDLASLRHAFEVGVRDDLVIPTIGTFKAYAIDWTVEAAASFLNGETAKFSFKEVSDQAFLFASLFDVTATPESLLSFYHNLVRLAVEQQLAEESLDFFESIGALVDDIYALKGQVDLETARLVGKIDSLIQACQQADMILDDLNKPPHHEVLAALQELGVASIELRKSLVKAVGPVQLFMVPTLMTVQQVATLAYGDTKRAIDVLKMNPIEDCHAIQPGTELRIAA